MQQLILIRGLPGSGKSTLAQQLFQSYLDQNIAAVHYEADQYFTQTSGQYVWDASKIGAAHEWCRTSAKLALEQEQTVLVSNTFTLKRELTPYFEMIQEYGKNPTVLIAQSDFGSVHDVPAATLLNMKTRFTYDISSLFKSF